MSTDSDREQEEIIRKIEELLKLCTGKDNQGQRWGKFKGDVVCRVVKHYINQRLLSSGLKAVGPSVYIAGYKLPWEFDLAIVKAEAKPDLHTNAYREEDICSVLEVKAYGVIAGKDEYEEVVKKRIARPFSEVIAAYSHIKPVYLAIRETVNPVKEGAIRYADLTRKALKSYPVFILQDARGSKEIQKGEWQRLIEYINRG